MEDSHLKRKILLSFQSATLIYFKGIAKNENDKSLSFSLSICLDLRNVRNIVTATYLKSYQSSVSFPLSKHVPRFRIFVLYHYE